MVEENNVIVFKVFFNGLIDVEFFCYKFVVVFYQVNFFFFRINNVVGIRIFFGFVENFLFEFFVVEFGDFFGDGEFYGDCERYVDFVDVYYWVGIDDCMGGEVDMFIVEVFMEVIFFIFEMLGEGFKWFFVFVFCRWNVRGFVVDVGSDVVLEEVLEVFDNQLWCFCFDVGFEVVVDMDDVDEFVGEVVFGVDVVFECD